MGAGGRRRTRSGVRRRQRREADRGVARAHAFRHRAAADQAGEGGGPEWGWALWGERGRGRLKTQQPDAEDAEVSQKTQKKFSLVFFCAFCATSAPSASGC